MLDGLYVLCFKQRTAYEMRISDWSSDVCSSDLSTRYRLGKFLRRNRTVVVFTAATAVALVGATVFSVVQMQEARVQRQHADRAAQLANAMTEVQARSNERPVGNECVSPCRSRWSPSPSKPKHTHYITHSA